MEDKEKEKKFKEVAKHLFNNVPKKKAVIKGKKVEYFSGSKAVDSLMSSKWASEAPPDDDGVTPHFPHRESAARMCEILLKGEYFGRGNKVQIRSKAKSEEEGEDDEDGSTDTPKRKKKYRLLMHEVPKFVDSPDEVFVWIYEPPSSQTYILGVLVVVGAVAATLYPLWPESSRVIIFYLSWVGLSLVGALLALYVVRYMLFLLVWLVSTGGAHFWIFPNLNEDLGIMESFKPFYSLKRNNKKKKSKRKDDASKKEIEQADEQTEPQSEEGVTSSKCKEREDDSKTEEDSSNEEDKEAKGELNTGEAGKKRKKRQK